VSAPLCACSGSSSDDIRVRSDAFTSTEAKILDFTFEGTAVVAEHADEQEAIVSQVKYAQGILRTASNASGHVRNVMLSNVVERQSRAELHAAGNDMREFGSGVAAALTDAPLSRTKRVAYRASLAVAWPTDAIVPDNYELTLPLDATTLGAFDQKYDGRCGKGQSGRDDLWQAWNPRADSCSLEEADVMRTTAMVTPDDGAMTDKYPEYDQLWADDRLDVVAIFGIIDPTRSDDWGWSEERRFVESAVQRLDNPRVTTNATSSSVLGDRTVTGTAMAFGRAREVKLDVLIVDGLEGARADFDARYDALTEAADLVLYSGHAGHGRNIDALVRKGKVAPGKYQLFLLNGCESFAHVDTTLTDRRREVNGSADPKGTRFLDVVTNAQPGYANNLAKASGVMFSAAIAPEGPLSYKEIVARMPERHVVVVYGEEDNTFSP
jgi:hypothetical protein